MTSENLIIELLGKQPQYLETVIAWQDEVWGKERPTQLNYSRQLFQTRLNTNQLPITLLALLDEVPVGMISIGPNFYGVGAIDIPILTSLYVLPAFRHQSIASKLILAAEEYAYKFGYQQSQVGAENKKLELLYEKLGYIFSKKEILDGERAVYMLVKNIRN